MSKNDKKTVKVAPLAEPIPVPAAEEKQPQTAPKAEKPKKAVKKVKKPNIFVRIGRKLKEVFSELKKVTWPDFPTVLKQTGVVIAVVSFFLIMIFAFDSLLSVFYQMLLK